MDFERIVLPEISKRKGGFASKSYHHPSIGQGSAKDRTLDHNHSRRVKYANENMPPIQQNLKPSAPNTPKPSNPGRGGRSFKFSRRSHLTSEMISPLSSAPLTFSSLEPETDDISTPMDIDHEVPFHFPKPVDSLKTVRPPRKYGLFSNSFSTAMSSSRIHKGLIDNVVMDLREVLLNAYPGKLGDDENLSAVINSILFEAIPKLNKNFSKDKINLDLSQFSSPDDHVFTILKKSFLVARSKEAHDKGAIIPLLSIILRLFYTSFGGPYPGSYIMSELGISYYFINEAMHHITDTFPGASISPSDELNLRSCIDDSVLIDLAEFLLSPEVSRSSEANKENIKDGTDLELLADPAALFNLYEESDNPNNVIRLKKTTFYKLVSEGKEFKQQIAEKASCACCVEHCYLACKEVEDVVLEVTEALKSNFNVENKSLKKRRLEQVHGTQVFLQVGYCKSKGCIRYDGINKSSTVTHCASYTFGDPHLEETKEPCNHLKENSFLPFELFRQSYSTQNSPTKKMKQKNYE